MRKNKINLIVWILYKAGNKFRNFVFRKRLGRKELSAKIIFLIMSFFGHFESKVYLNTGETGIFDHYVPRFLLKRWRVSDEVGTDKGSIFCWLKSKKIIKKVAINRVAGEIDRDLAKFKDLPSDFIRKKLFSELLESKGSEIIKRINKNDFLDLTIIEESTLAVFVGHQITRVPLFEEYLLKFFSVGYSNNLIKYSDFGNRDILIEKVAHNSIGITYNQLKEKKPHMIKINEGKSQRLLLSLEIASNIAEKIYRRNLHILEIPKGCTDEFVISDNPVVFLDFKRGTMLPFVPWWEIGEEDFWICMPISPRKAIFYCKLKKKDGSVEKNNNSLVELINFGQYMSSTNFVFAKNKETLQRHLIHYRKELYNFEIDLQ